MMVKVIWRDTHKEELIQCDKVTCDGSVFELIVRNGENIIFSVDAVEKIDWWLKWNFI